MKRVLLGVVALTLVASAMPVASAHYCDPNATPIPLGNDFGYVVSDGGASHGYVASEWFYQESNGIAGLQRGGTALTNGDADPCPGSEIPDTLLSGIALDTGQAPVTAPYPGFVLLQFAGGVPTVLNPLGFACGVPVVSALGGSITCDAPPLVPAGLVAGCNAPSVGAGFSALAAGTGRITGAVSCGAANAQCTTNPAVAGGVMCNAATVTTGALPVTCKAQLQPATYLSWAVLCAWS